MKNKTAFQVCLILAFVLIFICAAQVSAQESGRSRGARGGMTARLDADEDGQITQEEFLATFKNLDEDGDGVIALDETMTGQRERSGKGVSKGGGKKSRGARGGMTARLDADEDGQITQEEFLATFNSLDSDGNGIIGSDEMPQAPDMTGRQKGRK